MDKQGGRAGGANKVIFLLHNFFLNKKVILNFLMNGNIYPMTRHNTHKYRTDKGNLFYLPCSNR